jgi:hypothetical protein
MAFSPDGKQLAAGGGDKTLRVWSIPDGKLLWKGQASPGVICALAYSADGKKIATTSLGGEIEVWNAAKPELLNLFKQPCTAGAVAFLPDNARVIVPCGESFKIYAPGKDAPVKTIATDFTIDRASFSPAGLIAAVPRDSSQFLVIDSNSGDVVARHNRPRGTPALGGRDMDNRVDFVNFLGETLYVHDYTGIWRWQKDGDKLTFLFPCRDANFTPVLNGKAMLTWDDRDASLITTDYQHAAAFQSEVMVGCTAFTPHGNLLAMSCGWGFDGGTDWKPTGPRPIRVYSADDIMDRALTKKEGSQYRQKFEMPTPAPTGWD